MTCIIKVSYVAGYEQITSPVFQYTYSVYDVSNAILWEYAWCSNYMKRFAIDYLWALLIGNAFESRPPRRIIR
jgi:hypothetical protein